MPDVTFQTSARPGRPLLALAALLAALLAAPRPLYSDPAPLRANVADDALLALTASLTFDAKTPPTAPDRHALRATVAPYQVRLAVDKNAVHPLSGPVAVHDDRRLGSPGRMLRLISLAPPEPAVAAAPEPARAVAAVKKTSPARLSSAQPAPSLPRQPAPQEVAAATAPGHTILVAGDSLSIYLADALRPLLGTRPGTAFNARGKVSSGLARPDFFDWEREMAALAKTRPDTVVIMIAANDNKTMTRPDGVNVTFGRPGWNAEYARRVHRLVALARSGNPQARIYWVGAPVMADARLNADVAIINAVIAKEIAALPGCRFVDVWRTLADASGHYARALPAPGGPRTARTPDGVHLTAYGARLLAHAALGAMSPAVAELARP